MAIKKGQPEAGVHDKTLTLMEGHLDLGTHHQTMTVIQEGQPEVGMHLEGHSTKGGPFDLEVHYQTMVPI